MSSAKVKAALAVMERHETQLMRAGETFELLFACALADKPFIQRFKRSANGIWLFDENVPVMGGTGNGIRSKPVKLDADDVDFSGACCAYCGEAGVTICEYCRSYVCSGRSTDMHFFCRKSCGADFDTKRASSVSGSFKAKPQVLQSVQTGPREARGMAEPRPVCGFLGSGSGRR